MSKPLKPPKRITTAYLENVALFYLERFASSAENLRRVLLRRVERSARFHGDDAAAGAALVDELITRYRRCGLLDDQRFAESRSRSLHRRGASLRAIRQTLAARGLAPETIEQALDGLRDDHADPDLAAAQAYARRRRIGPYRPSETREAQRDRDMAALGRAGFSWDIARRVVDGDGDD